MAEIKRVKAGTDSSRAGLQLPLKPLSSRAVWVGQPCDADELKRAGGPAVRGGRCSRPATATARQALREFAWRWSADTPRPLLMRKGLRKDRHRGLVAELLGSYYIGSKQRSEEGWLFVIRGRGLMWMTVPEDIFPRKCGTRQGFRRGGTARRHTTAAAAVARTVSRTNLQLTQLNAVPFVFSLFGPARDLVIWGWGRGGGPEGQSGWPQCHGVRS